MLFNTKEGEINMGFLDGLMGNASTANSEDVEKEVGILLAEDEKVDIALN